MGLDESEFPYLIQELYALVDKLELMFPGRPFTPDGHLVGSLAECFAEYYYGLQLRPCSYQGHDGSAGDVQVEVKATQGKRVALRSGPAHLLVFRLERDGTFEEVYNGRGDRVWALVAGKPAPSNGQRQVSLSQLRVLMNSSPANERIEPVRPLPMRLQPVAQRGAI